MQTCSAFMWSAETDRLRRPDVLSWDGRIDNREDLRVCLGGGFRGVTSSPALVAAAFERWGLAGLGRIVGDWSAVLFDPSTQAVVLASDFMGTRPLYYQFAAGRVRWSTALHRIVAESGIDAVDERYVAAFLSMGGSPDRTPWEGIRVVPAGRAVSITAGGITVHDLWELPTRDRIWYRDERRYEEQFRSLFTEAVAVRLDTSAPVLAELSGGLDSTSIVCMASHLIERGSVRAPRLTTVSYVHPESTDEPFIREVEGACRFNGLHISTNESPLITEFETGRAMPEAWAPLHDSVASAARGLGATTLLSGLNGDLMMGNWFDDSLQVAGPLRRGRLGRAFGDALAWSRITRTPLAHILARGAAASLPPRWAPDDIYATEGLLLPTSADLSLSPAFGQRARLETTQMFSAAWMQAPVERRKHFRALTVMRELRALQRRECAPDLAYSHPFAHRPLVEFLLSIPADILCRPGEPRRLMRRALADLWPPRVRTRRSKSLFGGPWIDALRPLARRLLSDPSWNVVERGWVERSSFATRLERLIYGLECNEPQLRQIILMEYWLRSLQRNQQHTVCLRTA